MRKLSTLFVLALFTPVITIADDIGVGKSDPYPVAPDEPVEAASNVNLWQELLDSLGFEEIDPEGDIGQGSD